MRVLIPVLTFVLGAICGAVLVRQVEGPSDPPKAVEHDVVAPLVGSSASRPESQPRTGLVLPPQPLELFEQGAFEDAVLWILRELPAGDQDRALDRLLAIAGREAPAIDPLQGVVTAVLQYHRRSPSLLLAAAEIAVEAGDRGLALEYLLEVPQVGSALEAARARRELDRLIKDAGALAARSGDFREISNLLEVLLEAQPEASGWRLQAARVRLGMGDADAAEAHLSEVLIADEGTARLAEALAFEIAQARAVLPLVQRGRHWQAQGSVNGLPIELLVDTGASLTVLGSGVLHRSNAQPTGRTITVRTAAGLHTTSLFEVRSLRFGDRDFGPLVVAAMPVDQPGDGLLGMDVLSRAGIRIPAQGSTLPPNGAVGRTRDE